MTSFKMDDEDTRYASTAGDQLYEGPAKIWLWWNFIILVFLNHPEQTLRQVPQQTFTPATHFIGAV